MNKIKINFIDQPLILISQIQRSGGTLITQLFDSHKEIYAHPSELVLTNPKWKWNNPMNYYILNTLSMKNYALSKKYSKQGASKWDRDIHHDFIFDLNKQKYIFDFLNQLDPKQIKKNNKYTNRNSFTKRDRMNFYFTSFFNSFENYNNSFNKKKYISAFTPRINMEKTSVEEFNKIYPDGYIITIVRDPLHWLSSAKIHSSSYGDSEYALNLWLKSAISSVNLKKKYPKVILVNFEKLINDTENVLIKISKILKIDFNKVLIKPTFNGEDILSDSSFKPKLGIDKDTLKRSQLLSKNELQNIQKELIKKCKEAYDLSKLYAV